jgi:hypothetical protein
VRTIDSTTRVDEEVAAAARNRRKIRWRPKHRASAASEDTDKPFIAHHRQCSARKNMSSVGSGAADFRRHQYPASRPYAA